MNKTNNSFQLLEQLEDRNLFSAVTFTDADAVQVDLGPNESISLSGSIDNPDEDDYVSFVAPADGWVTVALDGDGGLDTMIDMYWLNRRDKIRRIGRNNNISRHDSDSYLRRRVRAGMTYYIGSSAFRDSSTGDYDLTLTSIAKDDYSDDPAEAKNARVNRRGRGAKNGCINYSTDVDLLQVTATKDGVMSVTMTGLGRNGALEMCQVAVSDTMGNMLSASDAFGSSEAEIAFEVTAGQSYYIYASAADDSVGKYKLRMDTAELEVLPAPDPQDDPDANEDQPNDDTDPQVDEVQYDIAGLDEITAADVVTSDYYNIADTNWLVVFGTDNDDYIEIAYDGTNISVDDGTFVSAYDGDVAGVLVLGFNGNDRLRSDSTLGVYSVLDGGAGDDSLYHAAVIGGELVGSAGDDMLVSIGGGATRLNGLSGSDSYWADSADTIVDASASEIAAKHVHVVSEFYQPYSDSAASELYIPLTANGEDLPDPQINSYANWQNFADSPLFVGTPVYSDIDQGNVGDCYFLSVLAGYAADEPDIIRQLVTDLGDGTYAVRFFDGDNEVFLRVDADLAVRGNDLYYAGFGDEGELWVAIVEKAYAYYRTGENDYESLDSGWMHTVYSQVSGRQSQLKWTSGMSTASLVGYLTSHMADGDTISAGSRSGGSGPIAGSHAYAILGVDYEGSQAYVSVYNPWGIDGRTYDSNYYDGVLRITAEQFKSAFVALGVSFA